MAQSVLQDWVADLPARAQGTLLTGFRGCDVAPKRPGELGSAERTLCAFLRFCVGNPCDVREVDLEEGCYYQSQPPAEWKASELGHYPEHFYSHLMHCFEIVGYFHPDVTLRLEGSAIYEKMVRNLHLNPETKEQCLARHTEDRIATGAVVS